MKMTLAKALKYKNRLAQRISELVAQIKECNVYLEGNKPTFLISELLAEHSTAITAMIELKAAIQEANKPILRHIFGLAELKGQIALYKELDTREGKQRSSWDNEVSINIVQIGKAEALMKQRTYEKLLDRMQAEVDKHNATTTIEFPDEIDLFK